MTSSLDRLGQGKSSDVEGPTPQPDRATHCFTSPRAIRQLLDEADEALDNETYPQTLAYRFDAPDDADYVISARTFRKLNKFIAAVDAQLKAGPQSNG